MELPPFIFPGELIDEACCVSLPGVVSTKAVESEDAQSEATESEDHNRRKESRFVKQLEWTLSSRVSF